MKILILGGTGFLGGSLVPLLVQRRHDVTVLTRNPAAMPRIEAMGATPIWGNLLTPKAWSERVAELQALVLIAQPPIFGKRIGAQRFLRLQNDVLRMHGAALGLAQKANCPIVVTSGTAFDTQGDEVADETWPLSRTGIARLGEGVDTLLDRALASGAPKFVRLMPGQIYGPGGTFEKIIAMAKQGRNGFVGDGNNCIPRVHVDDCADAYVRVIERLPSLATGESFIVADDVACSAAEFARELAEVLDLPPPKHLSKPLMVVLRVVLGKYFVETLRMHCKVSNQKLKLATEWAPRYPSYREGLRATVEALEGIRSQPQTPYT